MKYEKIQKYLLIFVLIVVVSISFGKSPLDRYENAPKKIEPINAPFDMPQLVRPDIPEKIFNIEDYGAKKGNTSKNIEKNTDAIHKAIEAAHNKGGGKVLIPKGEWWTGPIHLMSNINLHIDKDAVLHFSENKDDYLPVVLQRHEGVEAYNYSPLIYGKDLKNIALTGEGLLNGHGQHWWKWAEKNRGEVTSRIIATKVPLSKRMYGKGAGQEGMRPPFVCFMSCENILVESVTLKDTPFWNILPVYSQNIIVRDVTILSKKAPNGDGVNPSSCQNVLIEYNHFETGDDAVTIKSGLNEEALKIDMPTKNVVVRYYKAVDVQTGSGGIVFGSETSGGIENVYVHDAYFEGCDRGIRFKSERGRGNTVKNIFIHDIEMKDLDQSAINFNTYYHEEAKGVAPTFQDIKIHDVTIDGVPTAIIMNGLPEEWLKNFTLKNIKVKNAKEGARIYRVKNLKLENIDISSEERAMEVTDVFELDINDLTLSNSVSKKPFLLQGKYTDAVRIKGFPLDKIEFGAPVTKDMVNR